MTGTIIENSSGRKLAVLVSFLLLCQLICFIVGGLVAPIPANGQNILGTVCKDTTTTKNDTTKWFYNRGKGKCQSVNLWDTRYDWSGTDIVYAFQMPIPRESKILHYSRWQQNLIAILQVDMKYNSQIEVKSRSRIIVDARLAYRNKGDPEDEWNLYTQSIEKRYLDCDIDIKSEEYLYNCSAIPLFELGSLFHDFYLLNVRLPVDTQSSLIGHIRVQDMWLTVVNQNEIFTKVWLSLKAVCLPCVIAILIWFWRRIRMLSRPPVLLEKMLLSLGVTMTFVNVPFEFLTLQFDLPFMKLLRDIRQCVFYVTLFSFWLVFAREHNLSICGITHRRTLKQYWLHVSAVALGCLSLFIFNMCERGVQVQNPFYSVWVTDIGTNLAFTLIILFGIMTGVYFLFFCYKMWQVVMYTSYKTETVIGRYSIKCLNYETIIFRLKYLRIASILCAALTITGIILGRIAELEWKWDQNIELEYTSAFFTGVYGMWNIYIFTLLVLYAPSDKHSSAVTNV